MLKFEWSNNLQIVYHLKKVCPIKESKKNNYYKVSSLTELYKNFHSLLGPFSYERTHNNYRINEVISRIKIFLKGHYSKRYLLKANCLPETAWKIVNSNFVSGWSLLSNFRMLRATLRKINTMRTEFFLQHCPACTTYRGIVIIVSNWAVPTSSMKEKWKFFFFV